MNHGHDVFVSYARGSGLDWVRVNLFERLQSQQLSSGLQPKVFMDLFDLQAGRAWFPFLAEAIENSSNFVPVYTKAYFQSEMCSWELERAHSLDRAGDRGIIVPVLLEQEARLQIPFAYRGIQYVDVSDRDWFSRLCSALKFVPVPAPPPEEFFVRAWVEPVRWPAAQTRDISVIPSSLTGNRFQLGSDIRVGVEATRDCFITMVNVGSSGRISLLHPAGSSPPFCAKRRAYYFPGPADSFRFVLSAPAGTEMVRVYATLEKICTGAKLKTDGSIDLEGVTHAEAMCTCESLPE
jgi:hypothetical protein